MEDNFEIENKEEFMKQRNENIKKGRYAEVSILISENLDEPVATSISLNGVTIQQVAEMIFTLDTIKETLSKKYPVALELTKFMGAETYEV